MQAAFFLSCHAGAMKFSGLSFFLPFFISFLGRSFLYHFQPILFFPDQFFPLLLGAFMHLLRFFYHFPIKLKFLLLLFAGKNFHKTSHSIFFFLISQELSFLNQKLPLITLNNISLSSFNPPFECDLGFFKKLLFLFTRYSHQF